MVMNVALRRKPQASIIPHAFETLTWEAKASRFP